MTTTLQVPIEFSGKQALAWRYLTDARTTEIFYGGAAGGGKSFMGCVWHVTNRAKYPGSRGLIGRAKITALEQSTLKTLLDVCERLGYRQGIEFTYNQQKHIINWANGSETILKDLFLYPSDPDFISLGSTEFTDAFIDEGAEVTRKAFDIVNSRIRWKLQEYGLIPKVLVTCNPSPGWIKDDYITDPKTNKPVTLQHYQKFVRALVTDNPDPAFVSLYTEQLTRMKSDYDRERLLFGNWDVDRDISNPFSYQWSDLHHIGVEAVYDRTKMFICSIDFNVSPFAVTFWHFWQDQRGYHIHGIDEAQIDNGSIPAMIELIRQRYGHALFNMILTGDSTGNQRNIARKDNASHYMEIMRGLGIGEHQVKILANPTHENSRTDVNTLLFEAKQENPFIHIKLHPENMKLTIRDNRIVQCDAFGDILKRNRNDLSQQADLLDGERSCFNLLLNGGYIKALRR